MYILLVFIMVFSFFAVAITVFGFFHWLNVRRENIKRREWMARQEQEQEKEGSGQVIVLYPDKNHHPEDEEP